MQVLSYFSKTAQAVQNSFGNKTGSAKTRPLKAESRFFIKTTILDFDKTKNFCEEHIFKIRT